jgi:dCTP deaminase
MYLSDRDLAWAIQCGKLVFEPAPKSIDATSIDLHLDKISDAKVWNIEAYTASQKSRGVKRPELFIGDYNLKTFGGEFLADPPEYDAESNALVMRRANEIVLRPHGFLLWQTLEKVGTNPDLNADLICFVDGKSTKARTGIVVHLTAPTIHCKWNGKITLEIANLGPFDIIIRPNDVIAQLTVAKVTSVPIKDVLADSNTFGQGSVSGAVAVAAK